MMEKIAVSSSSEDDGGSEEELSDEISEDDDILDDECLSVSAYILPTIMAGKYQRELDLEGNVMDRLDFEHLYDLKCQLHSSNCPVVPVRLIDGT
ncbi:hypothetical protein JTB14_019010 [Gonioctena quinquepunctata]|nr:hypothetical protein JTB14_019010 [Gonioctena quinquepunctata]